MQAPIKKRKHVTFRFGGEEEEPSQLNQVDDGKLHD